MFGGHDWAVISCLVLYRGIKGAQMCSILYWASLRKDSWFKSVKELGGNVGRILLCAEFCRTTNCRETKMWQQSITFQTFEYHINYSNSKGSTNIPIQVKEKRTSWKVQVSISLCCQLVYFCKCWVSCCGPLDRTMLQLLMVGKTNGNKWKL